MRQAAELANDGGQSGRDNGLVEGSEQHHQHQRAEDRADGLASGGPLGRCGRTRVGIRSSEGIDVSLLVELLLGTALSMLLKPQGLLRWMVLSSLYPAVRHCGLQ